MQWKWFITEAFAVHSEAVALTRAGFVFGLKQRPLRFTCQVQSSGSNQQENTPQKG
jgi:hypothetical protein